MLMVIWKPTWLGGGVARQATQQPAPYECRGGTWNVTLACQACFKLLHGAKHSPPALVPLEAQLRGSVPRHATQQPAARRCRCSEAYRRRASECRRR